MHMASFTSMEPNVFDFDDYRRYLQEWLAERKAKNPAWSHRMVAEKVGLKSGGHISLILNGKANLKEQAMDGFVRLLKLRSGQAEYFRQLVLFNQATEIEQQREAYQRLLACREAKVTVLQADQYKYYSHWYYSALREALNVIPFNGTHPQDLGSQMIPALSGEQVLEALAFLQNQNMVAQDANGFWRPTQALLTTGPAKTNALHFHEHVAQVLDLARGALERVPAGQKYNSWITMSMGEESFAQIVEEVRAVRQRILKIVEKDSQPNRVYHMNLNLFPVTHKATKRRS